MRAVPASLRLMNQRRLFERLRDKGLASRAELADLAGMSRPTAGKIIDELLEAGVVAEVEVDPAPGRLGRPGRALAFERRTPRFVLVELGVQRTSVAFVPVAGSADEPWSKSFATPRSVDAIVRKITEAAQDFRLERAWAFALSMPGVIDERTGISHFNPNLHVTEGASLLERLRASLELPGCVIQEIRALALGHRALHPALSDFLLADADDGIGAAAVVDGQIALAALPSAGELGHTRVPGNDRPCGCGAVGCVETLLARPGLLRSLAESTRKGASDPSWSVLLETLATGRLPAWFERAVDAGGAVLGGALNVIGLPRLVLTGSFLELPPPAFDALAASVRRSCLPARFEPVEITAAPRQRARGLIHCLIDRLLIPTTDWALPCRTSRAA